MSYQERKITFAIIFPCRYNNIVNDLENDWKKICKNITEEKV